MVFFFIEKKWSAHRIDREYEMISVAYKLMLITCALNKLLGL